jgi:hypothetical protein
MIVGMRLRCLNPWLTWLACVLALTSAAHADEQATVEGIAYFEQHIRPLLVERCYACHSAREKKQEGGLLLDSRAGWVKGGEQGPAVIPGDVEASLLIRAVRYEDAELQMPPDRPLPKEAVARLVQWVKLGAPDPREGGAYERDFHERPSDPIAGRAHWAFRPLSEHRPPQVAASA